ncbi:MAG: nuclear transport factor 2 family protein [Gammaproteobacteria bacterium]|nr:nuclear transport factor 2 family protein [Gammaproteobacteria bacterium]
MPPDDEFKVRVQCERLVYRFLQVLEQDQAKVADFFAADGQAFALVGREKIREHFAAIAAVDDNVNVNLSTNLLIDVDDEDHARATNYVTHYVADREADDLTDPMGGRVGGELDTARSITRWSWEFRRVEGEWLISKLRYPESVLLRKDVIDQL